MEVKGGSEGDGSSGGEQGVGCCVGFGAPVIIAEPLRESDAPPELPPLGQAAFKELEVLVLLLWSFFISTAFEEALLIEEDRSGGGFWTDVEFRRLNFA